MTDIGIFAGSERNDQSSLFEYIEIFYNRERSHSTLDYVSLAQFEQQQLSTIAA